MFPVLDKVKRANGYEYLNSSLHSSNFFRGEGINEQSALGWDSRKKLDPINEALGSFVPNRLVDWRSLAKYPESF